MFGLQGTEKPTRVDLTIRFNSGKEVSPAAWRCSQGPKVFGFSVSVTDSPYLILQLWAKLWGQWGFHGRWGE